jgi:hypothetical protein
MSHHRYQVQYGNNRDGRGYIVRDTGVKGKRVAVFMSDSKRACITKAQELNGWTPADGLENTYAAQAEEATQRRGR